VFSETRREHTECVWRYWPLQVLGNRGVPAADVSTTKQKKNKNKVPETREGEIQHVKRKRAQKVQMRSGRKGTDIRSEADVSSRCFQNEKKKRASEDSRAQYTPW